jgi:hypothetical protein
MLEREDPMHGAVHEIISGISSLNMEPDPVTNPKGPYISDLDKGVNHAIEHFDAAIALLQRAAGLYADLKYLHAVLKDAEAVIGPVMPPAFMTVFSQAMERLNDRSLPEEWLRGPMGPKDWRPKKPS